MQIVIWGADQQIVSANIPILNLPIADLDELLAVQAQVDADAAAAAASAASVAGMQSDIDHAVVTADAASATANGIDAKATTALSTSDAAASSADAAVVTANTAAATATSADAKATSAQASATAAQRAAGRHPMDFGAVLDGVTDDTEAIRALHDWCNANNSPPSYRGVQRFAVQADAQIVINTDVDFCGATIRVLGGVVPVDGWSEVRNIAFVVEDPARPLVSGMVLVDGANFAAGSYDSCAQLIPGAGYVFFQHDTGTGLPRIAARDRLTSRAWRISNKAYSSLKTQWPMPVAATGLTQVYRSYRLNSASEITVGNAAFLHSDYTNQRLFDVKRNGVTIRDVAFREGSGLPARSTNDLIRLYYCSDITVERIIGTNPSNDQFVGSYVVYGDAAANVLIRDCDVRGGDWAWEAAHFCNGWRFEGCDVPRIDMHEYSMNFFVDSCVLHERGVAIGHGGGFLKVTNTIFHQTREDFPAVQGRSDYGRGSWDGDIVIDGFTIISSVFGGVNGNVIVDLGTNPMGNAAIALTFPHSITVRNGLLQTHNPSSTTTRVVMPVFLAVDPTGMGVRSPRAVSVSDIACGSRVAFSHKLDLASCLAPLAGGDVGCAVTLSGLLSTHYATGFSTLAIPATGAAPRATKLTDIYISGCTRVALDLAGVDYNGSKLRVEGGSVGRVAGPAAMNYRYDEVDFDQPLLVGAETAAPICPAGSGGRYCSIVGGRLVGAYDLSLIRAVSGLVTDTATIGAAVLPGGVTRQQLFTGWIGS